MNKSALKKFAVTARTMLMEQVALRAALFGISKDTIEQPANSDNYAIDITGMPHDEKTTKQRNDLVKKVRTQGFEQVIEEAAYTWFNRFMALRFMEVNDYLPTGTRVLSSIVPDREDPDILVNCLKLDLPVDKDKIYNLQDKNDREGLYRYLLILQCNELNSILPFMFEPISDYTELLLPDNLLYSDSVIKKMVKDIDETDWKEVEVIGWLYQYYISEKKEDVFKGLKRNVKISDENIPAATQLFTPKWIVQYMVENSVGKYWLENRPDKELQKQWKYYIEPAEQDKSVIDQLNETRNSRLEPESIKIIDPCMGSGHMLVYAFEVLYEIYKKAGYSEREIAKLIIENNLYGLDIDDRAAQLAQFALVMKARKYSRRILRKPIKINLCSLKGIGRLPDENLKDYPEFEKVFTAFKNAKTIGSLANPGSVNLEKAKAEYADFRSGNVLAMDLNVDLDHLWMQTEILLSNKYDVVITNPPYMGGKGMTIELAYFMKKNYKDSKSDLFAAFIEKCHELSKPGCFVSMITQHAWMFLSSYEKLRTKLVENTSIDTMVHLGPRAFEEIGGEVVQTTAFVNRSGLLKAYKGSFARLVDYKEARLKEVEFSNPANRHTARSSDFSKIPGSPIAYWVSDRVREIFEEGEKLGDVADPRLGMSTNDNNRFLRIWHEVTLQKIKFDCNKIVDTKTDKVKWYPYNKGGSFRKWYGNFEYLINWSNNGFEVKEYAAKLYKSYTRTVKNIPYFLKKACTWSLITSGSFSIRYMPDGFIIGDAGPTCYPQKKHEKYVLGVLNSKISNKFLKILNPTLNFSPGVLRNFPLFYLENIKVDSNIQKFISLARQDWDNFETSWDFTELPLLTVRSGKWEVGSPCQCEVGSEKWEVLKSEEYGDKNESKKSQGFIGMAKINEVGENDISADKTISTGRNVLPNITNAQSSDINTIKHSRGASKEVNQGIHQLSINSSGIKGRTGNTGAYSNRSGIYRETGCSSNTGSTAGNQEDAAWFEQQSKINNSPKVNQLHTSHSPLSTKISSSYSAYFSSYKQMTLEMQRLEEENNRIFIDAYGLQDELTPEVPLHEITLTGNPFYRYNYKVAEGTEFEILPDELAERFKADTIKEFISYAVGCMMGRYSLEVPGLILAGVGKSVEDYYRVVSEKCGVESLKQCEVGSVEWEDKITKSAKAHLAPTLVNENSGQKVNQLLPTPSTLPPKFIPDSNAILPVLDDDYFSDDIVARFVEFVKVTFGEENISDNLSFIADAIGRKGNESSIERIRKYFLKDFYKDHCQRYKKRPIYWMFTSGKKKGFNCLIYLHRYQPGMIAQIRTDYLHELQEKLTIAVTNLEHDLEHGTKVMQKKARKRKTEVEKQAEELVKYDELMRHYADQNIDLDLDDGVKVNYTKFGELLEKVK